MANINIFGTLVNASGEPIVRANQVEGGYFVVANADELDAMPSAVIKDGSLAYNQNDSKFYIYDGSQWKEAEFSGGGSVTTVNADLEYNLSVELRRKEGTIRDEVTNITTTLVSFAFENNEMPDVDFANIKVNTTLNFSLTQQGESQTAVYHIESYGTFTKMNMTANGAEATWIHITVPAYEQNECPSNIELAGINGSYVLFNEFGYLVNKLYTKADKEDLATVATSGDYDDLTNKPTIPTKTSDLENDMKFVSIAEPINVEGYKQLLYIEANGAQAIETSIIPNQNTSFDLDYMSYDAPTSSNSPQIINAGGRGTQPRLAVSLWVASKLSGEVMINTTSSTAKMSANVRSLLRYVNDGTSKKIIYSDNTTTNLTINNFEAVGSIIIFALKNGDIYDRFFNGRLYGLKLYNQTTLTHNFVPVMRLSDNEVGLLDVEDNNTFYTNNGTGTFGYGELSVLSRVSELVMDRNIITDNNFTNVYKNQIQQNANDIADIQALLPTLAGLNLEVVNELPTQDISTSTIYLVPKSESGTNNVYDEYIYVNNAWEKIGDTELDLSNYVEKEQGKGLSTNDFTDLDKNKLDGIEDGAEENVIESILVNGTAATITNKEVELSVPQQYVYICKNYGGTTSVTITASSHGCGNMPLVQCYMDNAQIDVVVAKNSLGDVTVSWNGIANVSAQNPLTICILGMSVTPVEEQQSVPDASDFPYLEFTKTDEGECGVVANWEEELPESVNIPAAIMLDGEALAVTSINDYAFPETSLKGITIPNSVTSIGEAAFDSCLALTSITIPGSVTSIGNYAFNYCENLETVSLGSGVESIGDDAFHFCHSLTSITIPDSVTSIGMRAFDNCESLTSVNISNSVTIIDDATFSYCSALTSITIPDSVTSIGSSAFESCSSLASVTIPDSVTSVGYSAFSDLDSNAVINCEAASKPAGWDSNWTDCENIVWGATMP